MARHTDPPASGRPSVLPSRPTRLGRFDVLAKIAGGGMASIYLARAANSPDVVALKVMRQDMSEADENFVRMFIDEANLIAKLEHPGIVRTLEVGLDAGQRFIAMELLLGKTLANVYDAVVEHHMRIDAELVAWIGARIADALAYAHRATDDRGQPLSIIHRDVNPANVFVTFDGDVKLFDFGLAKTTQANAKSVPGIVKGKLPYLSPEQIMQMPLDHRSDLFGLGTSLWELLTGKRLFHRPTDGETLRAVHVGPIPDVRSVDPTIPIPLSEIIAKALQRNRDHRYESADKFRDDLDAAVGARAARAKTEIAGILDALFPGERKRQLGLRKPAIVIAAKKPPSRT